MRIRTQRLPIGYRELEYLESTGTQFINSTVPSCTDLKVEIKNQYTQSLRDQTIFCVINTQAIPFAAVNAMVQSGDRRWQFGVNGTWNNLNNEPTCDLNLHTLEAHFSTGDSSFKVDGVTKITSLQSWSLSSEKPFRIFANFVNSDTSQLRIPSAAKVYYCKVWCNGTLFHNFIPAERMSDNKPGLYDIVSNVFYTNQGTGEFIKGSYKDSYQMPVLIEEGTTNLFAGKTIGFADGDRWKIVTEYPEGKTFSSNVYRQKASNSYWGYANTFLSNVNIPTTYNGKYLTFSCWYYRVSSASKNPFIDVYAQPTGSSTLYTSVTSVVSSSGLNVVGEWTYCTITIKFRDDLSNYARLTYIKSPEGLDAYLYVANIQLELKDHATPYVNGTRPDNYVGEGNPKINIIPNGYQGVDYIKFSGTGSSGQFLRTGINTLTPPYNVRTVYLKANTDGRDQTLVGQRQIGKYPNIYKTCYETELGTTSSSTAPDNAKTVVEIKSNDGVIVNGNAVRRETSTSTETTSYELLIGAFSENDYTQAKWFYDGNIYDIQIINDGKLYRHYIPCYRKSDNEIGMYEILTHTFLTNQGTGTFTKGNDKTWIG